MKNASRLRLETQQLVARHDFPLLQRYPALHYLDNASTTQQPQEVIDAQQEFAVAGHASPHRTLYDLGVAATERYEAARHTLAAFFDAPAEGTLFTANATAALNLAAAIEGQHLAAGDEIVVSVAEHHSNMLPWQRIAAITGAKIVWLERVKNHHVDLKELRRILNARTKVVAVAHISNVLGSVAPLADITALAHRVGARVVVDAAQSAGHVPLSMRENGADYLALSGHKMYGPTGIGMLCAKPEYLQAATPVVVGGGTVMHVSREEVVWHDHVPERWEAGTPHTSGAVGLAAAAEHITSVGFKALARHEQQLTQYALAQFSALPFVHLYGPAAAYERAGIFSFSVTANNAVVHSHDVVSIANEHQVALRGGQHCASPLMTALGVSDLVRASLAMYSTIEDIDALCDALIAAHQIFSHK